MIIDNKKFMTFRNCEIRTSEVACIEWGLK